MYVVKAFDDSNLYTYEYDDLYHAEEQYNWEKSAELWLYESGKVILLREKGDTHRTQQKLIDLAKEAMTRAYAPYSGYKVGAALLCADGSVYCGCNIENAAFSPTVCAERTAFFKAVYDGHRDFTAIAVCGGKDGVITDFAPPCGVCRQVMKEFCDESFIIYLVGPQDHKTYTLAQLLPVSFSL